MPGSIQQGAQANVVGPKQPGQADFLAAQILRGFDVLIGHRNDGNGILLVPARHIDNRQPLRAGQQHLFPRNQRKLQLVGPHQGDAIGFEGVVELNFDARILEIAAIHGHVKGRILHVGNVTHRHFDVRERLCRLVLQQAWRVMKRSQPAGQRGRAKR